MIKQGENKIIEEYIPLVRHIASKYYIRDSYLNKEDLVSCGMVGLLVSMERYNPKSVEFKDNATVVIKSYILNEIRKTSVLSERDILAIRNYYDCISDLQFQHLREPSKSEICTKLDISLNDLDVLEQKIELSHAISLDLILFDDNNEETFIGNLIKDKEESNPADILEQKLLLDSLHKIISSFTEEEQLVLSLYYKEELTFIQIGYVMDISPGAVARIHRKLIKNIRKEYSNR